jgi:hypothetical protein
VDIYGGVSFCWLIIFQAVVFIFGWSGETEAGPAGEQPARDTPDGDENVPAKELFERIAPLLFSEPFMP